MVDEQTLFDRFHEALDLEPRPGAYERLRTELTRQPVALPRRPAFRVRFSKMALRMTAALVAVLIAIALIVTFIVTHNRSVGEIPAGNQSLQAYRALLTRDYGAMNASTSDHCGTIDDAGCAAAVLPVDAALQKWADDLNAFPTTPTQYKALASTLRAHLLDAIKDLNAAVAYQKVGDAAGFNLAMRGAFYQRAWIDPPSFVIEGSNTGGATSYSQAVSNVKHAIRGCIGTTPGPDVLGCHRVQAYEACDGAQMQCEGDLESAQTLVEQALIDMARNPSSDQNYAHVQSDLVAADAGLLAVHDALFTGGSGDVNIAETAFSKGMESADSDLAAL